MKSSGGPPSLAGDVVTMDKLLAEDYFGISVSGQLNNKMQQLERLKSRNLIISKLDVSDRKVKLVGPGGNRYLPGRD